MVGASRAITDSCPARMTVSCYGRWMGQASLGHASQARIPVRPCSRTSYACMLSGSSFPRTHRSPAACLVMRLLCVVVVLQLWTTDLLMMRKAQDRAGLHGGLGGLQGMKGLAGFGATLASNKFVRAAIREDVRWSIPQSIPLVPLVSIGSG